MRSLDNDILLGLAQGYPEKCKLSGAPLEQMTDMPDLLGQSTDSVALRLKLSKLLEFLQGQTPDDPELQMICPLLGIPLPHINIQSVSAAGVNVRIELSLKSSEALIRFVLRADDPSN